MELERQILSINEYNKEQLSTNGLEKEGLLKEITNLKRERDIIKNRVVVILEKIEGIEADL
jgi:hypothetical protein